jgi:hypothetical protein
MLVDKQALLSRESLTINIMLLHALAYADSTYVASNFRQYCLRHGYMFKHHHYTPSQRYGVYASKWAELQQFWSMADWLLLVDSDSLIANLSRPFDPFLQDDKQHVLLQLRPRSREVDAAAVAMQTSPWSRCFLQRWLAIFEQTQQRSIYMNNDNGPLLQAVLEVLSPQLAESCFSNSNYTDYNAYRVCWEGVFLLLPHAHEVSPIRVYMPLAGFLREHIGAHAEVQPALATKCTKEGLEQMLMQRCWSNDVIVSGWKQIGAGMWAGMDPNATLARCHFNTLDEELLVVQTACFVEYPGCSAADGTNTCRNQPQCSLDALGSIQSLQIRVRLAMGFGLPRLDVSDPVWQSAWPPDADCNI